MNNKLLSVIIPVYNEEKYLKEAINSVIAQTYRNLEIIVVDDGSIDMSPQICDYYGSIDKRIKVLHQNNGGMIAARYAGIEKATGEYVIFVDGDDFIEPEMYMKMMAVVEKYNVDMVGCGAIRYRSEDDFTRDSCYSVPEGLYLKEEIEKKIYPKMLWDDKRGTWAIDPSLCMKIIKKKILLSQYEKLKKYSFSYGEDSAVLYPAILEMDKIYFLHECYYYHRIRTVNTVAPYLLSENYLEQILVLYKYLYECFLKVQTDNNLIFQLDMFYIKAAKYLLNRYPNIEKKYIDGQYLFPFDRIEKGSRIILYGAGKIGKQYWKQINKIHYCRDVLWVDKNAKEISNPQVVGVENIDANMHDYVVIAIKSKDIGKILYEELKRMGWKNEQIIIPEFDRLQL